MSKYLILLSIIVIYLIKSVIVSKIFKKANIKGYKAFIPIYEFILFLKLIDYKWYHIFKYIFTLGVITLILLAKFNLDLVNVILFLMCLVFVFEYVIFNIRVGKKFNKGNFFILGLILLPIIFYILLAFKGWIW